jgi:hypothetical protein
MNLSRKSTQEFPPVKKRMRILCAIHPPKAIRKILDCLGLPSRPPLIALAMPETEEHAFY